MTEKTRIWVPASKTDPKFLKKVSKGAWSFHAIAPYYQFRKACEAFGPEGEGWGVDGSFEQIDVPGPQGTSTLIVYSGWVWHSGDSGKRVATAGCCELAGYRRNGDHFVDHDAHKKALTDAKTKGLSYLGFDAEVFLGAFDDNKYTHEPEAHPHVPPTRPPKGGMGNVAKTAHEVAAQLGGMPKKASQIIKSGRNEGKTWGWMAKTTPHVIERFIQEERERPDRGYKAKNIQELEDLLAWAMAERGESDGPGDNSPQAEAEHEVMNPYDPNDDGYAHSQADAAQETPF